MPTLTQEDLTEIINEINREEANPVFLTTEDIADLMGITPATVRYHAHNLWPNLPNLGPSESFGFTVGQATAIFRHRAQVVRDRKVVAGASH